MDFGLIARNAGRFISDNSPMILTVVSVLGTVSTTVTAVRATPEALRRIEALNDQKREDAGGGDWQKAKPLEVVKATWTVYIPAAAIGGATIACILGANTVSSKRNAALLSLYSITEKGFQEYKKEVVEQFGVAKEQHVRDEVVRKGIESNPPVDTQIIFTDKGDVLCKDEWSGRYFRSTKQVLERAENTINRMCINEMYASLNDFYREVGLPINAMGEEVGWSTDVPLEIQYSSALTPDDEPCLSINYKMNPIRGYRSPF